MSSFGFSSWSTTSSFGCGGGGGMYRTSPHGWTNDGAGAVAAQWAVTGTGNTVNSNSSLNWVSGPYFDHSWVGLPINIDGTDYVVEAVPLTTPP